MKKLSTEKYRRPRAVISKMFQLLFFSQGKTKKCLVLTYSTGNIRKKTRTAGSLTLRKWIDCED